LLVFDLVTKTTQRTRFPEKCVFGESLCSEFESLSHYERDHDFLSTVGSRILWTKRMTFVVNNHVLLPPPDLTLYSRESFPFGFS
jgi:hypothetical protein